MPKFKKQRTSKNTTVKTRTITPKKSPILSKPAVISTPVTFRPCPKPDFRKNKPLRGIPRISAEQIEKEKNLKILKKYLLENRADGKCEIPGCESIYKLQECHLVERSVGGMDTAGNILIGCENCHSHEKYAHGLPFNPEYLLNLISLKNAARGISNYLTGAEIREGL
jgi:hypothetical protein